jgi:hypothetical protein
VSPGAGAEGGHQRAAVAAAAGRDDGARPDALDGDRDEVGPDADGVRASRDDRRVAGGDELELVGQGLGDGAVRRRPAVGPGVDAPLGVPGRVGLPQPDQRLVGDVVQGHGFLAGQPVTGRDDQDPGLGVEDRHVQLSGREQQPGHHRVRPVVAQRRGRLVACQVKGAHVGAGMPAAQFPHRRGDEQASRVPDGDPAGPGGRLGARDGAGGRAQQRPGLGQEDLAGLGKPAAARGAIDEAGADLPFQAADLPGKRRLGGVQFLGGPAEVKVLRQGGKGPHDPQVEVHRRVGHASRVARRPGRDCPRGLNELRRYASRSTKYGTFIRPGAPGRRTL